MGLFGKSKSELLAWQKIISPCTPKLVMSERELNIQSEHLADRLLKIIQESANLCNTTKKPQIFFERYDLIITHMETLAKLEKYVRFSGGKPSLKLIEFKSIKYREINSMIDRYWSATFEKVNSLKTTSAKLKHVNAFKNELDKYSHLMNDDNISKYNRYFNNFEL